MIRIFWNLTFVFLAFITISSCRPDDFPRRQFPTCDPIAADLVYTPSKLTCVFKLNAVTANLASIEWDFGDGSKQTNLETSETHTYRQAGTYTVKVNVTDKCKNAISKLITITVNDTVSPIISAIDAIDITDHEAILGLRFSNFGNPTTIRYGICYSYIDSNPRVGSQNVTVVNFEYEKSLNEALTKPVNGLQANSTYYFKAFAISSVDTTYSDKLTFNTLHEITVGLVAHLTFDNGPWDATSYGNDGTIFGTYNPAPDHKNQVNKAFYFDGATSVRIPDHISLRPQVLSISFWFKAQAVPTSSNKFMQFYYKANYNQDNSKQYSSSIDWNTSNIRFKADVMQGSNCNPSELWKTSVKNIALTTQWYHAVIVYANKKITVYINGTEFSTYDLKTEGIDNCSGGSLNIGAQSSTLPNYFTGTIDDFRVYNIALTPEQVAALNKI